MEEDEDEDKAQTILANTKMIKRKNVVTIIKGNTFGKAIIKNDDNSDKQQLYHFCVYIAQKYV